MRTILLAAISVLVCGCATLTEDPMWPNRVVLQRW
jgi:hypothetical protein